jgi:VIT1/CCC1 family predicted Fe2+/Mn2+ transporter
MQIPNLSSETIAAIKKFQRNEMTEHLIYKKLAVVEKDPKNQQVLLQISQEEKIHYDFFYQYSNTLVAPNKLKVWYYYIIARILGLTFSIKLMEKGESNAQHTYSLMLSEVPAFQRIIDDEGAHEQKLIGLIEEERLNYVGSIVLGLNDALVELTGALAGFTFALHNTKLVAVAGLITGIAASFSMGASEYLSQKTEGAEHPLKSSIYTGLAYVITVGLLIMPYLLIGNIFVCLATTLSIAVFIIFAFNYYISVAKDLPFKRRFVEMTAISLGVAAITFGIGYLVKRFIGLEL